MKYNEVSTHLKGLSDFLNSRDNIKVEITEVVNPNNVPFIGDKIDENKHSIPYPPSSKLSKTSGIYIFVAEDGTILYIGKAGEDNVREGKAKVGIFKVEPAKYSSFVEVYLHTIDLPEYCMQIG